MDPSHVQRESYAQAFTGVRQDSGSPADFIKLMRKFYDDNGVEGKKTIVFSDSLNVDKCLELKAAAEKEDLQPSFGVGTFFTSMSPRTASRGSANRRLQMTSIIKATGGTLSHSTSSSSCLQPKVERPSR